MNDSCKYAKPIGFPEGAGAFVRDAYEAYQDAYGWLKGYWSVADDGCIIAPIHGAKAHVRAIYEKAEDLYKKATSGRYYVDIDARFTAKLGVWVDAGDIDKARKAAEHVVSEWLKDVIAESALKDAKVTVKTGDVKEEQ